MTNLKNGPCAARTYDGNVKHGVVGWVKNLPDGRVQLLAEGPSDAVDMFLKAIREHWKVEIDKEQAEEQKPSGKYKDFGTMR